jgi:hypothetical protein
MFQINVGAVQKRPRRCRTSEGARAYIVSWLPL